MSSTSTGAHGGVAAKKKKGPMTTTEGSFHATVLRVLPPSSAGGSSAASLPSISFLACALQGGDSGGALEKLRASAAAIVENSARCVAPSGESDNKNGTGGPTAQEGVGGAGSVPTAAARVFVGGRRDIRRRATVHPTPAAAAAGGGAGVPQAVSSSASSASVAPPLPTWVLKPVERMTATDFTAFREDVGIEVTARNHKQQPANSIAGAGTSDSKNGNALKQQQNSSGGASLQRCPAPVRCWGELLDKYIHSSSSSSDAAPETAANAGEEFQKYGLGGQAGVAAGALKRRLEERFPLPSAIQTQTLPIALSSVLLPSSSTASGGGDGGDGPDLLGVAETGSGKTLCYVLPSILFALAQPPFYQQQQQQQASSKKQQWKKNDDLIAGGPYVLICVPTRELAAQVVNEIVSLVSTPTEADSPSQKTLRVVKIVGGEDMEAQYRQLADGAHIVVGTPGQLLKLLEQSYLSLHNTKVVCVDEVDRMVDDNMADQLEDVLRYANKYTTTTTNISDGSSGSTWRRRTIMFTATLLPECERIATKLFVTLPPPTATAVAAAAPNTAAAAAVGAGGGGCGFYIVSVAQRLPTVDQRFAFFEQLPPPSSESQAEDQSAEKEQQAAANAAAAAAAQEAMGSGLHPQKSHALISLLLPSQPQQSMLKPAASSVVEEEGKQFVEMTSSSSATGGRNKSEKKAASASRLSVPYLLSLSTSSSSSSGSSSVLKVIVFANTKRTCELLQDRIEAEIDELLFHQKHGGSHGPTSMAVQQLSGGMCACVHGDHTQEERTKRVAAFRNYRGVTKKADGGSSSSSSAHYSVCVLVTTDLLARGLDVPGVQLVVSFDAPPTAADDKGRLASGERALVRYKHRVGRTGRAGDRGVAVTFLLMPSTSSAASASERASEQQGGTMSRKRPRRGGFDSDEDEDDDEVSSLLSDDDDDEQETRKSNQQQDGQKRKKKVNNGSALSTDTLLGDAVLMRPLLDFVSRCAAYRARAPPGSSLSGGSAAAEEDKRSVAELGSAVRACAAAAAAAGGGDSVALGANITL